MSNSTKKIGRTIGGTSHSRISNLLILDIIDRLLVSAGARCSQSPLTAGVHGDVRHMMILHRIARLTAIYLSAQIEQGCNPVSEEPCARGHYRMASTISSGPTL